VTVIKIKNAFEKLNVNLHQLKINAEIKNLVTQKNENVVPKKKCDSNNDDDGEPGGVVLSDNEF
jgi:hypothetical protein